MLAFSLHLQRDLFEYILSVFTTFFCIFVFHTFSIYVRDSAKATVYWGPFALSNVNYSFNTGTGMCGVYGTTEKTPETSISSTHWHSVRLFILHLFWICNTSRTPFHRYVYWMTSWLGNALHITGPLWGESTGGFPSQMTRNALIWWFFCCSLV